MIGNAASDVMPEGTLDNALKVTGTTAYIGIGANLGNARLNVETAFGLLRTLADTLLVAHSELFGTIPLDADGDDYVNAVACIETCLSPTELLAALQAIEHAQGRQRCYVNAPRTLDLDILLYGQQILHTPTLTIPHPRLMERAFALVPLLQISANIEIPGHGPAQSFLPNVASQHIWKIAV